MTIGSGDTHGGKPSRGPGRAGHDQTDRSTDQPLVHEPDRERPVLVVADHVLIGALVESLVEVAGHRPVLPLSGETALDAIGRVHPGLVLLDIDHESAVADDVYDRARESGSRVLLFASGGDDRDLARAGARHGVATCHLPIPHREFAAVLARALEG